jgi:hypothetical protein
MGAIEHTGRWTYKGAVGNSRSVSYPTATIWVTVRGDRPIADFKIVCLDIGVGRIPLTIGSTPPTLSSVTTGHGQFVPALAPELCSGRVNQMPLTAGTLHLINRGLIAGQHKEDQ